MKFFTHITRRRGFAIAALVLAAHTTGQLAEDAAAPSPPGPNAPAPNAPAGTDQGLAPGSVKDSTPLPVPDPPAEAPAEPLPALPIPLDKPPSDTTAPVTAPTEGYQDAAVDFRLLDQAIQPGTWRRLKLAMGDTFAGKDLFTYVHVLNGRHRGPVLCITGGVHGDEVNGVEIVRRLVATVTSYNLRGVIIGIPIINLMGFRRQSRYLPDRRDLNRHFPGRANASMAGRIGYHVFSQVIKQCNYLVDYHTGSFERTNLAQVRADLTNPRIKEFALSLNAAVVIHSLGPQGTLRRAAVDAGIVAVLYESGGPRLFQKSHIEQGVVASLRMMNALGMVRSEAVAIKPSDVFYKTAWVRSARGGIMMNQAILGQFVLPGAVLGTVIDPVSSEKIEVLTPIPGRVIGMALPQLVLPGYALFHIGLANSEPGADRPPAAEEPESDE